MPSTLLQSALLFVLFGTVAAAQAGRFEGRLIHEADGTPVAGATVSIVGVSGSIRTDEDGRFIWAPAPPLPFQLIVVISSGQVAAPGNREYLSSPSSAARNSVITCTRMGGRVAGADDRPGPSEIAAPAATLVDLGGGWRIVRQLELRGVRRNLLNDTHHAGPDPRFVLAPGRSASVTTVVEF